MDSYKIKFKPAVEKDLRSLPRPVISRILKLIENLRSNPFPRQAMKLHMGERHYRLRVGEYRIVFEVDEENKEIVINYVRHRRRVYRDL